MSDNDQFALHFQDLTGNSPFPWQSALYERFMDSRGDDIPSSATLPTGLGKTSIIAIWLIALAHGAKVPRRLVYVVNRRTVVDQTTTEAEMLQKNAAKVGIESLAVSTLRGQFADNREWCADPSCPAIICGTIDMIGSRLLFGGYGIGFKSRPLHAGFLGQDVLLIHDEAHLEPAFQKLIEAIAKEQARCNEFGKFHVMALTATSRGDNETFKLTSDDEKNEVVRQRIFAAKKLQLEPIADPKKSAEQIAQRALQFQDSGLAVLVFVRLVDDALKVRDALAKVKPAVTLTGTMRGKERDALVEDNVFARFLPKPPENAIHGTAYLVCTSAGEVGVNISADHLVCDLSTFDSIAQRFGRVNRFGTRTDTVIHVLHPTTFDDNNDYEQSRARTLELLRDLTGNASPSAINKLDADKRQAAFAPTPIILPTSEILFDAWALTSIKGKLPGRQPVEPYLHGLPTEWQPPETYVAWREEVEDITGDLLEQYNPADLLSEYPLKPHELLREPNYRAFKQFEAMAKRLEADNIPVWLLNDDGSIQVLTLAKLADKNNKARIDGRTVILPPSAGGMSDSGMLDGSIAAPQAGSLDVADDWFIQGIQQRKRVRYDDGHDDQHLARMHEILAIRFPGPEDDEDQDDEVWRWLRLNNEGDRAAKKPVQWCVHVGDVERETAKIVDKLPLPDDLKNAVRLAAKYHDHGKRRRLFQRVLRNADYPNTILAKSGGKGSHMAETYRHEFGSLLDVEQENLGEHRDLILHLIAAHHGRARPNFPAVEVFDPERPQADAYRIACEVPRRFARLQRQYGRWGLAYLESLLRAGDWTASSEPSQYWDDK